MGGVYIHFIHTVYSLRNTYVKQSSGLQCWIWKCIYKAPPTEPRLIVRWIVSIFAVHICLGTM